MNYAEEIKKRRKDLGITQIDLAEFTGLSLATIKDIERSKANPALTTMETINTVLGLEFKLQIKEMA